MELRRLIGYGNMISCLSTNDGVIKDLYSPTWYNTDAEQVSIADNDRFGKVIDINNCEKGIYVSASDLKLFGIQEFTIGFWQNTIEVDNNGGASGFVDDNFLTMIINACYHTRKCGSFKIGRSTSGSRYDVGVDFGNGTINIGEWAHYCATKNKRGYRCYVNGKAVSTNYYDDANDRVLRTNDLKYMCLSPMHYNNNWFGNNKLHTQTYNFFMSSKGIDVNSFEITKPVTGLMYKEYDENGNIYSI